MKPLLLLTNDDGYHAPGLRVLWDALKFKYTLLVVAPWRGKSWIGKAITNPGPLTIQTRAWDDQKVHVVTDGTPADCTNLGLFHLATEPVTAVISGINNGANFTNSLALASGTVGGALEAALNDVLGIAVSLDLDEATEAVLRRESFEGQEQIFQPAARAVARFLQTWFSTEHDPRIKLVNLIVPQHLSDPPQCVESTPLPYIYGSVFEKRGDQFHNRGRGFTENSVPILPNTDVWNVRQGRIAYTCYTGNLGMVRESRIANRESPIADRE